MAVKSNHGTYMYLFVAILGIMMCTVHGRLVCRMVDFPNVAINLEDFPFGAEGNSIEDCKELCLLFSECMSTAYVPEGIFRGCYFSRERVDVQPGTGDVTVSLKECMEISTLPPTTLPPTTDIMSTTEQAPTTEKNVYPGYGYGYGYRSFQSRLLNFLRRYRGGK